MDPKIIPHNIILVGKMMIIWAAHAIKFLLGMISKPFMVGNCFWKIDKSLRIRIIFLSRIVLKFLIKCGSWWSALIKHPCVSYSKWARSTVSSDNEVLIENRIPTIPVAKHLLPPWNHCFKRESAHVCIFHCIRLYPHKMFSFMISFTIIPLTPLTLDKPINP